MMITLYMYIDERNRKHKIQNKKEKTKKLNEEK